MVTQSDLNALSEQERNLFLTRNQILSALGSGDIQPHIYLIVLKPGDKILLTSDGIHDNLTRGEIDRVVKITPAHRVADVLVEGAQMMSRGGSLRSKADDTSAIVVEVSAGAATVASQQRPPENTAGSVDNPDWIKIGETVRVPRTSGIIDEGWEVLGYNRDNGDAIVGKYENGKAISKEVPPDLLKQLNPRQN